MLQAPLYLVTLINGDYRAKFGDAEAPCKLIFIANTNRSNSSWLQLPLSATEADIAVSAVTPTDGNLTGEGENVGTGRGRLLFPCRAKCR